MADIDDLKVSNEWMKIEDIQGISNPSGNDLPEGIYQLIARVGGVKAAHVPSGEIPSDNRYYIPISEGQCPIKYNKVSGYDLYLKSDIGGSIVNLSRIG